MPATRGKRISRTVSERVTNAVVASLTILPDDDPTEVVESATQQFTVTGVDSFSGAVPLPSGSIVWTRSSAPAGSINASTGLFTAGTTPGTYQVTATHTASGTAASVDVEVVAP